MAATSKNGNFENYLRTFNAVKGDGFTHTRIGDKALSIFGGSYKINDSDWKKFMEQYYEHVFVKGNKEYLTEKQLIDNGPVMIDIDFRYETSITTKQHSKDHIIDALYLYADKIKELVDVTPGSVIEVFVMEKDSVNPMEDKTKDGIHIIIGLKMHKALQVLLRKKVLSELKNTWDDLPVTNSWEDILDEGVTKGFVNWQLYGSRKPAHKAYMIKYHFKLNYNGPDTDAREWSIDTCPLEQFSTEKNIHKLSARYTDYPGFPLMAGVQDAFEAAKDSLRQNTDKKTNNAADAAGKNNIRLKNKSSTSSKTAYSDINSEVMLDNMLETLFEDIGPLNYRLKETHEYTMSLPAMYFGPGSYNKWIRVGMALHNTHKDLFLTWLKFSCQENCSTGKFDWRQVPDFYDKWEKFSHNSSNSDCLTYRSIMYWSKNDAKEKHDLIQKSTIDYFIRITTDTDTPTEFDLASVLYNMYKDRFVCTSIKNKTWFEYINHRWHEIDSGNTLRLAISKEMHHIYSEKIAEITNRINVVDDTGDGTRAKMMAISQRMIDISTILKQTQKKQNIMREACELFYDSEFLSKLDRNPYLMCFKNGIVDFNQKCHRKGQPDDFVSKCTNIDYVVYNHAKHGGIMGEINAFMAQLFPIKELETYMWQHLASCLIGVNINQTFHVYKGSGRNGKSALTALMSKSMGSYKGTVPITLITTKRNSVGSTSSEVAQLDGIRYAVMQEPSKGDKINEGSMKELTGGTDPIQARALFKDSVTFVPQFKLVVCTNLDFEETSNDDGTWRRMRYIEFMSKFMDNPYGDEIKFPRKQSPYQFILNKKLEERFDEWVPVFMSELVKISYEKKGVVEDCNIVMANSDKHREGQDYFAGFVKDNIRKKEGASIKKTNLMESFKVWYAAHFGKNLPKGKEIMELMNQRFGIYNKGWHNIEMYIEEEDAMDDA
jgi:P4 family phage/plasmid primase-like protien